MKNTTKKSVLRYALCIGITVALGALSSLFVSAGIDRYDAMMKPSFAPPDILFPIAWTILYVLMGVSLAMVLSVASPHDRTMALRIYSLQLAVNLLWPFFFFTLSWLLFAFIWLLILIALTVSMMIIFASVRKNAALLQLPYLGWLIFAAVLNQAVWVLNS